jgi:hypothetical protein
MLVSWFGGLIVRQLLLDIRDLEIGSWFMLKANLDY